MINNLIEVCKCKWMNGAEIKSKYMKFGICVELNKRNENIN